MPVWTNDLDYRIESYPEGLKGSFIVDSSGAQVSGDGLLDKNLAGRLLKGVGRPFDTILPTVSNPPVGVLPRSDIRVFVFLENMEDFGRIESASDPIHEGDLPEIILSNGTEQIAFHGKNLHEYSTIPHRELSGRYFFLISAPFF